MIYCPQTRIEGVVAMTNRVPVISLRDLMMKYDDEYVLRGINLDVYEGQIIGTSDQTVLGKVQP